tara:strand:+ start:226 stop:399 length:174 start_codon:yes stop_codon:yes gene_type:complete
MPLSLRDRTTSGDIDESPIAPTRLKGHPVNDSDCYDQYNYKTDKGLEDYIFNGINSL